MYFPKVDEIYGSEHIFIRVDKPKNNITGVEIKDWAYKITKTHWKALDTPDKRCDDSNLDANTTQCITRYLEDTIGCSMGLSGSDMQIAM